MGIVGLTLLVGVATCSCVNFCMHCQMEPATIRNGLDFVSIETLVIHTNDRRFDPQSKQAEQSQNVACAPDFSIRGLIYQTSHNSTISINVPGHISEFITCVCFAC